MSSAGKWVQMNSTLGWLKEANTVCDCWNTSFYLHDLEVMLFWFAYSTCLHLLNGNFCCNFFSGKAAIPHRHDTWKPSGWMMTCWRQRLLWEIVLLFFITRKGSRGSRCNFIICAALPLLSASMPSLSFSLTGSCKCTILSSRHTQKITSGKTFIRR